MRFWNDMQSKYGFGDGDAVPDGVEVYRAVYIRAVNQLAAQLGSAVRATAYDRAGVHNWCLVLFYRAEDLAAWQLTDLTQPLDITADTVEPDDAMNEAIRQAYEFDLDSFVRVTVQLDTAFEAFVTDLQPIDENAPLIASVNGQPQHIYPGGRVHVTRAIHVYDGRILEARTEFIVTWIDPAPHYVGLAEQPDAPAFAIVSAEEVVVLEIPAAVRDASANAEAVPPYYLRNAAGEVLEEYGTFYQWHDARNAVRRALRDLEELIHIVNGYGNPVMTFEQDDESE